MIDQSPSSPISLLNYLPSTGEQVNTFANGIVRSVKDGQENPLNVMLQIRAMEKAFKVIMDQIKDEVVTEADKYPGTTFKFRGVDLAKGDVSTSYDYTICGDTEWERRKVDADSAKEKLSEREAFLKALKEPVTIVDEMTGEVVTVRPPLKKSVAGVKFFIK
jgi:hypothetical protein